jgi:hypothetical protein
MGVAWPSVQHADPAILALASAGSRCLLRARLPHPAIMDVVMHHAGLCGTNACPRNFCYPRNLVFRQPQTHRHLLATSFVGLRLATIRPACISNLTINSSFSGLRWWKANGLEPLHCSGRCWVQSFALYFPQRLHMISMRVTTTITCQAFLGYCWFRHTSPECITRKKKLIHEALDMIRKLAANLQE